MPKSNRPKKTWRYSNEFKRRAVELSHQDGIEVKQVAQGLGIHPFMLSRWRKEYREGLIPESDERLAQVTAKPVPKATDLAELAKARKEVERLKKENDLLKKWQRYLADRHQSDLDSSRSTAKS